MSYSEVNGYEVLQLTGSFGCAEAITHARFQATYGQGFKSSVIVDGAETGMKSWNLQFKALIQTLDKVGYIHDDIYKEADYLWDFYCRYAVSGEPFVIKSLRNGQNYLAEFSDEALKYELFATRLFTTGIGLSQRRLANVSVFDAALMAGRFHWYDASQLGLSNGASVTTLPDLIIDLTPPLAPEGFAMEFDGLDCMPSCLPAEDPESEVTEYIFSLSWGS